MGKSEEAEKNFIDADELCIKIKGTQLHSIWGGFYVDFLISANRINEAFELTKQNLEISINISKNPNDISRCHRCLASIERMKGNYEEAEFHIQEGLNIARKINMTELEIEALIENGRLRLDLKRPEDAIGDAENVLKICVRTGFRFYEPGAEVGSNMRKFATCAGVFSFESLVLSLFEIAASLRSSQ